MRTALRALVVAATAAGALTLPAPAQAATIASLDCLTSGPHSLTCSVTGLVANPFTIRWYRDGATIANWNDKWIVTFYCRPAPVEIEVRVVLDDVNGEAEETTWGVCGTN